MKEIFEKNFKSIIEYLTVIIIVLSLVIPITIGVFKDKELKKYELELQTYGEPLNQEEN